MIKWNLFEYIILLFIMKQTDITFKVRHQWNLNFCSFCLFTIWGNHWGQRSKLWEPESGHQWVSTLEQRPCCCTIKTDSIRSIPCVASLWSITFSFYFSLPPSTSKARVGVTLPLCLFCLVFSTSSSSSSLLRPLFLGVVNLKEP